MKFIVNSTDLLSHLLSISKAISVKSPVPILDHFLFELYGNVLTITASDLESTMITKLEPVSSDGEGSIALEAKRLIDIMKEFSQQPLTFEIDTESFATDILSENGKFSVVGTPADEFPRQMELNEEENVKLTFPAEMLDEAINKTLFATANDELRPVMNGIYFDIKTNAVTIAASDSHKLVKYMRKDITSNREASFILPKKPASLLRSVLSKENNDVEVEFDNKNAVFKLSGYKLICRLTEGKYPNYESVIPVNNPNKLILNRNDFFNTVKRVSVFSNQASNLVKLKLGGNQLIISAQDIDFSISAYERLDCQYDGEELEIGFKSVFLTDILSNMDSEQVVFELSDAAHAAILLPLEQEEGVEEIMLIMPLLV